MSLHKYTARILNPLLLLGLLLSACASSASQTAAPQAGVQSAGQSTRQPGCTVVTRKSTPGPTGEAVIAPPTDKDWIQGPADAYVTITEYSDFE
jgi:protein-disulfide isomerase